MRILSIIPLFGITFQTTGVNVDFHEVNDLGAEPQFVADEQDNEEDQADVCDEEIGGIPGNESGESLGEDDEYGES